MNPISRDGDRQKPLTSLEPHKRGLRSSQRQMSPANTELYLHVTYFMVSHFWN